MTFKIVKGKEKHTHKLNVYDEEGNDLGVYSNVKPKVKRLILKERIII